MITHKLKFVLIGNTEVGKTALLLRLVEGKFSSTIPTIGVEFRKRNEIIDQNDWVVELWDTTGQERYRKVVSQFFRGIHGAIVVFDLTNESSLDVVEGWVADINNCAPESTPKILFGNKSDLLEEELSKELKEKIERIANANNLIYFQGSVKTGDNVEEMYCKLLR